MPEMAASSEELVEDVEWVATAATALAALFVLLDPFGPILIVNFAQVRISEGLVCLGNFDKLLRSGVIVGVLVRMVLLAQATVGFLELAVGG